MAYRFALIIVLFVLLAVYIIRIGTQGKISGMFRTVSLILLCVLLGLSSLGYYYSRQQSVDTLQERFSAQKETILHEIQSLQEQQKYTRARELADSFLTQVQDHRLKELRQESRRLELEAKLQNQDLEPQELLQAYQELSELTQDPRYSMLWQEQKQKIRQAKEQKLLQHLEALPEDSLAQRLLVYHSLLQIKPEESAYQQQRDNLQQSISSRIDNSLWSNVCGREGTDSCEHIGWLAFEATPGEQASSQPLGEILGVTWRPRSTLISRDGDRAQENSYYYILYDWGQDKVFLQQVDSVQPQANLPN
ncbi:MAG: hypothetical protein ACOC43_07040 [Desulfohalobiaceae bacterium]